MIDLSMKLTKSWYACFQVTNTHNCLHFKLHACRPMLWLRSLQVQGHVKNLIEEHFKSDLDSAMRDPILFGDYRTALKSEPRVYEDILDYDASKALFQVHRYLNVPFTFTPMCLADDFIQSMHCTQAINYFSNLCITWKCLFQSRNPSVYLKTNKLGSVKLLLFYSFFSFL